jgi:hypothetical protein
MSGDLPLLIQRLGGYNEQTLVMAHVAGLQNSAAIASPAEIRAAFINLRLPPPSNVSQHLKKLAGERLVMQPSAGTWAVTPLGLERIRQMMEGLRNEDLSAHGQKGEEPSFSDVPHHLIPSELAPAAFQAGIARFLEGHPFDRNVLAMSRFPRDDIDDDPMDRVLPVCRATCQELGLELHLASDRAVEDLLFGNVAAAMWASRYGIAILEDTVGEGLNYNAVLEVGAMLVTGRRCLLLKDVSIPEKPTDLIGHIHQTVDVRDPQSVRDAIRQWITKDLAIA